MKKITIGLFNDSFYPMIDGVVSVVDNYARYLSKYANVIVFAPRYTGKKYDDSKLPYKVVRCASVKLPFIDYSLPMPKLDIEFNIELSKYKLDIVHIHSPFTLGKLGISYAKKHKVPVIGTMHSQFKKDILRAVNNNLIADILTKKLIIDVFEKCDECWAVNEAISKLYHEDYHYKEYPLVMNNATEMLPIPVDNKTYIKLKNKYKNKENIFLFVGRINKLKNIFFIANSLEILKKQNFNFTMIFVGSGQDEKELKDYINKKNLTKNVVFPGRITNREELACYYKLADLLLFPSMYDASSIVQLEAASQSTPTVFIEGSATSSTCTDKVNGFISKPTKEDYAKYIKEIMLDKKLYKEVSKNAHKDIYITWDKQLKNVYKRYLELIDKKEGK